MQLPELFPFPWTLQSPGAAGLAAGPVWLKDAVQAFQSRLVFCPACALTPASGLTLFGKMTRLFPTQV